MSDDDSFDPRSWGGGAGKPSVAPPVPPGAGGTPKAGGAAALPDAWKAVLEEEGAVPSALPAATKAATPSSGPRSRAWMPYAASLAVLAVGAGAAWTMREDERRDGSSGIAMNAAGEAPEGEVRPGEALSSRSLVIASMADLSSALAAAGLSPAEVAEATAVATQAMGGAAGEIRVVLDIVSGAGGAHLDRLQASFEDGSGAVVARTAEGRFAATRVAAELSKQIKVVSGELDSESFYTSAVAAGVTDSLIPEFVNAFSFDFNLAAEVKAGDTFEVAYEQTVNAQGQPLGQPQLLYAQLVTATKRKALYRFKPADQEVGWFDGNGASTVRSFMRTPIDGARITSKFGPRFHPVLHYTRLHGGTDFAAPVGTPIYAAAGGVVVSASPSRCAGNMVIIKHDNDWETRYFHLSSYAEGVAAGFRVNQGFTIGGVGNTGTCTTGPHLHYEVHVEGQKVDPLSIQTDAGRKALEGTVLAAFIQQRDRVDVARARQSQ